MAEHITIGNAQGFWGDSPDGPSNLLRQFPALDYLTLDYLAEVSLSILALQRSRDEATGYARDFPEVVRSLVPLWQAGGKTKIVCNAGGLNPVGCARACQAILAEAGVAKKIGVVTGDDVLPLLQSDPDNALYRHWESGAPVSTVIDRLMTANAYIGAACVRDALDGGADIVLTGRVADPSLTAGIAMHAFGWDETDYPRIAAATVAGHVLECGTQACGGISTNWLDWPDAAEMGFPYVELFEDGHFSVTKPAGTGGAVNLQTVKEQLLYEIGDPANYLSPDCRVDFTSLRLQETGVNRVTVSDVAGFAPTDRYKVSATYRDGYWAQGTLTIFGQDAVKKAQRCGEIVLARLARAGYRYDRHNIECLGANAVVAGVLEAPALLETVLRIAVADQRKEAIERFAKEIAPLVTSGPQGTTGYAGGRPKPTPVFAYWPCFVAKAGVSITSSIVQPEGATA